MSAPEPVTDPSPAPAIRATDLYKGYGLQLAVDGLNLEVPRELLLQLPRRQRGREVHHHSNAHRAQFRPMPDRSRSSAFAMPKDGLEIKRRIGAVPDESMLFDRLTGIEFLEFAGRMYGLARATAIDRARDLMGLFELADDGKIIGEYSKGMRKRVAMAASLIHHPELFLMDEPFEGVDAVGARLMKDILLDQVRRGATIFLTSHVLEVVERLCDRVAIIDHGKIVTCGSMEEPRRRRIARRRLRAHRRRRTPSRAPGLAMIAAILRAQFLSMQLNRGKGMLLRAIPLLLWYCFWTVVAVFAFMLAAAWVDDAMLRRYLPLAFLGIALYWQFMPVLTASLGRSLDLKKLAMYPVPHGQLFTVEVLLCLTSNMEMVLVISGGLAGIIKHQGIAAARAWILLAGAVFIAFNALLASGTRQPHRPADVAPQDPRGGDSHNDLPLDVAAPLHAVWRFAPNGSALSPMRYAAPPIRGAPPRCSSWAKPRRCCGSSCGHSPRFGSAAVSLNAACASTLPPLRRKCCGPMRRGAATGPMPFYTGSLACFGAIRSPRLSKRNSASLARTPRFRMVFVMGFTFGVLVWLPMALGRGLGRAAAAPNTSSRWSRLYALAMIGQVTYWNAFGFDRSAAMFYFAAPQPMARVFIAKNIAAAIFVYLDIGILAIVVSVFHLAGGWPRVAETLAVVAVCALYLFGLGNMASVNYPRALNPERVTRGSGSGRAQGLLFLFYPFALLPVVLAYVARWALQSEIAFLLVLALAAVIGGIVYGIGLDSAVLATGKREELLER